MVHLPRFERVRFGLNALEWRNAAAALFLSIRVRDTPSVHGHLARHQSVVPWAPLARRVRGYAACRAYRIGMPPSCSAPEVPGSRPGPSMCPSAAMAARTPAFTAFRDAFLINDAKWAVGRVDTRWTCAVRRHLVHRRQQGQLGLEGLGDDSGHSVLRRPPILRGGPCLAAYTL